MVHKVCRQKFARTHSNGCPWVLGPNAQLDSQIKLQLYNLPWSNQTSRPHLFWVCDWIETIYVGAAFALRSVLVAQPHGQGNNDSSGFSFRNPEARSPPVLDSRHQARLELRRLPKVRVLEEQPGLEPGSRPRCSYRLSGGYLFKEAGFVKYKTHRVMRQALILAAANKGMAQNLICRC